jgi:hypothetical protein
MRLARRPLLHRAMFRATWGREVWPAGVEPAISGAQNRRGGHLPYSQKVPGHGLGGVREVDDRGIEPRSTAVSERRSCERHRAESNRRRRALQARASPLGHGVMDGPGGSCTHDVPALIAGTTMPTAVACADLLLRAHVSSRAPERSRTSVPGAGVRCSPVELRRHIHAGGGIRTLIDRFLRPVRLPGCATPARWRRLFDPRLSTCRLSRGATRACARASRTARTRLRARRGTRGSRSRACRACGASSPGPPACRRRTRGR